MLSKINNISTRRLQVVARFLKAEGISTIVQGGCSEDVSTLLFAKEGFSITLLTNSDYLKAKDLYIDFDKWKNKITIIDETREQSSEIKHESFDFLLLFNTIYYGTFTDLRRNLDRFLGFLRRDGFFYLTLISTKHGRYGQGNEIEPNTFYFEGKKTHFSDASDIVSLLRHVEVIDIRDEEQEDAGSFHWHILGRNRIMAPADDDS